MYEVDRATGARGAGSRASDEFACIRRRSLAAERVPHPGEDLLTDLVQARDGGDRLSAHELVATAVLLLNAGHEASVNGFGNGLVSLLRAPVRRSRPAASSRLVEEMLRHDSPLHLFERTATCDVEVGGVPVRERGEGGGAARRREPRPGRVRRQPDVFVPTRDPNSHLAFGLGIHFCLGAPLARLELETSVSALLRRFGGLALVEVERRPTFVLRGYERVLVSATPERRPTRTSRTRRAAAAAPVPRRGPAPRRMRRGRWRRARGRAARR